MVDLAFKVQKYFDDIEIDYRLLRATDLSEGEIRKLHATVCQHSSMLRVRGNIFLSNVDIDSYAVAWGKAREPHWLSFEKPEYKTRRTFVESDRQELLGLKLRLEKIANIARSRKEFVLSQDNPAQFTAVIAIHISEETQLADKLLLKFGENYLQGNRGTT